LSEWHPSKNGDLTPAQIPHSRTKKVWWRCSSGHEWQATPSGRVYKRSGCPYCSGSKIWPGFNDLKANYPQLAREWHPSKNGELTPDQVRPKSTLSVWWQCANGHEWQEKIKSRTLQPECPRCRLKRLAAERKKQKDTS